MKYRKKKRDDWKSATIGGKGNREGI